MSKVAANCNRRFRSERSLNEIKKITARTPPGKKSIRSIFLALNRNAHLLFYVTNLFQIGKREQYEMVDGCSEKSHIAELHQKQALQVAAIRNRKNTNHDQSKVPRSASNSAWNYSWPTHQEVPSGTPNHNTTT